MAGKVADFKLTFSQVQDAGLQITQMSDNYFKQCSIELLQSVLLLFQRKASKANMNLEDGLLPLVGAFKSLVVVSPNSSLANRAFYGLESLTDKLTAQLHWEEVSARRQRYLTGAVFQSEELIRLYEVAKS